MGRWTQYEEDSARLPNGMKRTGYDADTRRYTFSDENGVLYQSEPGNSYGILTPVKQAEEESIRKTRPNAFESSDPEQRRARMGKNTKLNSFEEFLPSQAIASPPPLESSKSIFSTSPTESPISTRRLPDVLNRVKSMRTVVSRIPGIRSHGAQERTNSSSSPPPSPPAKSATAPDAPRMRHRHRGYSQLPASNSNAEEYKGLLRSATVSTRASTESSNQRLSPRPPQSNSLSRSSTTSKATTITVVE